jgi:hypothetical protein
MEYNTKINGAIRQFILVWHQSIFIFPKKNSRFLSDKVSTKLNNGINSSFDIVNEIKRAFKVEISPSIVRQIRREDGLVYRRLRKAPKLNAYQKLLRYLWCMVTHTVNNSFVL